MLGLKRVQAWEPEPVMIGAGSTKLALFRAPRGRESRPLKAGAPRNRIGYLRVAFLTDGPGFESAQEHLTARGIAFRGPVDHGGWFSIYFVDPDGLPLEVTRPAAGRSKRERSRG